MKIAACLVALSLGGCSSDEPSVPAADADSDAGGSISSSSSGSVPPSDPCVVDAGALTPPERAGSCNGLVEQRPLYGGLHVAQGAEIGCNENPPTSGPHYPVWAAYQTFTSAVPRGNYVHDLEHGGIVLAYNCNLQDASSCADVAAAFETVRASLPDDPLCDPAVRVRVVVTPDPLLPTAVAALSWGWRYGADCIDLPALEAFAKAHYGHGSEATCANGGYVGP